MNNYFYVDIDDEITTVLGKLREEESEEIFLVVPKKSLIAQSLVNLKLLGKEARKLRKKIIFVSPDANIRKIAEKAGLTVKKYVAKPKKEPLREPPVLEIPAKRKLSPWEEEAAKSELDEIIGKKSIGNTAIHPPQISNQGNAGPRPISHYTGPRPAPEQTLHQRGPRTREDPEPERTRFRAGSVRGKPGTAWRRASIGLKKIQQHSETRYSFKKYWG